jgi:hypothetical protein
VFGEEAASLRPVARRVRVADGVDDLGVVRVPPRGGLVQLVYPAGICSPQQEAQQIGEEVVVAKPQAPRVQCGHERVSLLEVLQDPLGSRASREEVRERPVHPLEHRGAQKQGSHVRRLAIEHLSQQVVGDRTLAAGELGHELLLVGVLGEGDRCQPQAGDPAFGALVEGRQSALRQFDPGRVEQFARLLQRKPKVGSANLGQVPGETQPGQREVRVSACHEHQVEGVR